jgi:hypothetical protein
LVIVSFNRNFVLLQLMARGKRGKPQKQLWLPTKANIKQGCAVLGYSFTRLKVRGRRKYPQKGQKCGHHAINNLFGKQEEVIAYESMVSTACQLNATHPKAIFGGPEGLFHAEVLKLSLRKLGFDMRKETNEHGTHRDHMWLGRQTEGKFLALGWVGTGWEGHWIAVDADCGLVIDSAERDFLQLDVAGVLKALPWGISMLFRVTCSRHNHPCVLLE